MTGAPEAELRAELLRRDDREGHARFAYLDARSRGALAKLIVRETKTATLGRWLRQRATQMSVTGVVSVSGWTSARLRPVRPTRLVRLQRFWDARS